jgi:hypothetical protein
MTTYSFTLVVPDFAFVVAVVAVCINVVVNVVFVVTYSVD